jgi:hypothetical protein
MRKTMILAAPLLAAVLVAGCKGKTEDPAATASAGASVAAPVALPSLSTNARTAGSFAGTYSQTGTDGKVTSLKLNADDTYEWTGADGVKVSGGFNWYRDGSTILLDEAGGKAVYALADGGVYKLASNDAPRTGLTADQLWTKAP